MPRALGLRSTRPSLIGEAHHRALGDYNLPPYTQVVRYPTAPSDPADQSVTPLGITPAGTLTNLLNATFKPGGTIDTRAKLEQHCDLLMIFGNLFGYAENGRDGNYGNYRARYRNYPEGDRRNLHVFTPEGLACRARGSGVGWADISEGKLEAACVRFLTKFRKGSIIEVKARLGAGEGGWPAFWFYPGEQDPYSGSGYPVVRYNSDYSKPSFEVDIMDNYGWDGQDSRYFWWIKLPESPPSGQPNYHQSADLYSRTSPPATKDVGRDGFALSFDNSAAMHTYSCEWRDDDIFIFRLDGTPINIKRYYCEPSAAAHMMLTNEPGPLFNPQIMANLRNNGGVPDGWTFWVEHCRIWTGRSNLDISAAPYSVSTGPADTSGLTITTLVNATNQINTGAVPGWHATENTLLVEVTPLALPMPDTIRGVTLNRSGASDPLYRSVQVLLDWFGGQGFSVDVGNPDYGSAFRRLSFGGAWQVGVTKKLALRIKAGDWATSVDGVSPAKDTTNNGYPDVNAFTVGGWGTTQVNATIRVRHIAGPVTDGQLQALSA